MLWLMFYVCLTRYFSNGPLWSEDGLEPDFCKETWWKNLVYVNNLVDTKNQVKYCLHINVLGLPGQCLSNFVRINVSRI